MPERMQRTEIGLQRERCFLVGVRVPGRYDEHEDPLAELAALVQTAGGGVAGRMVQNLDRPHPRTFVGRGKFESLIEQVAEARVETVVVDDDLSPKQLSTMEEGCRAKVIDRSEVILDIFNARARTHQAKLQVELAQLEYELPRLVRKWTHLERLGGGIGTRGPGESQIETDRRILRRKIRSLREELDRIKTRKEREVRSRHTCFTVCLVGYTNAGKTTLLNRLTGAAAPVADRLFATLDTLTRRMELDDGTPLLVSDTVGFIRRLPAHLVASFHATLEEAAQADLLLHVIDGTDPLARRHRAAVDQTLEQLGLADRERFYVYNKADAVTDSAMLEGLCNTAEPGQVVSAHTGEGLDDLLAMLKRRARAGRQETTLRFPATDGRRFALVNEIGQVQDIRYDGSDVIIRVVLRPIDLERLQRLPGDVRVV